jgi:hypothetical protein
LCLGAALASAALIVGSAAGAATATTKVVTFTDKTQLTGAQQALSDYLSGKVITNRHVETFESFGAWTKPGDPGTSNPQSTNVGNFTGLGTKGSGNATIKGGTAAEVRGDDSMAWGRYNTARSDLLPEGLIGGNWLDSNDMTGLSWSIGGLGKFNTLAFFLIDAEDVGGQFSLKVGDQSFTDLASAGGKKLLDGNLMLVLVELSEAVESLTVELLMHDKFGNHINDGFGIDGAILANIAPVPLPPAAALLFVGIAALAGVRRRKAA